MCNILLYLGGPANKDKKRPPTVGTQMKVKDKYIHEVYVDSKNLLIGN